MDSTVVTHSAEETEKIGEKFAGQLEPGTVICLYGNLGAGKTTFTKGIARGLGVLSRIISPTFTLVRQHSFENNGRHGMLYHIDLYRLENANQISEIGLPEILQNAEGITIIEWSERLEVLPAPRIDIHIYEVSDNQRKIKITSII